MPRLSCCRDPSKVALQSRALNDRSRNGLDHRKRSSRRRRRGRERRRRKREMKLEEILQPVKKTGRTARARPSNRAANSTLKKSKSASSSASRAEGRRRVALRKTTTRARPCPGLQRLLQRFEEKEKDAAAYQFNKDKDWKLSEKEIRDAKSRLMGDDHEALLQRGA